MKKQFWEEKNGQYLIESEAFSLASIYLKYYSKFSQKHFTLRNVKKSKYWSSFVKTVELRGREKEWDINLFIKISFEEYGKIYPFKLYTNEVWNSYCDYYKRGFEDRDKTIALSLLNAYNTIKVWNKRKGNNENDVEAYFKNPLNIALFENKKLSSYLLSISKTFKNYYFNLSVVEQIKIVSPKELETCRRAVFRNKKILKKMKELLKDEFDGGTI